MKWGIGTGYTKSETRGMLRNIKEDEYIKDAIEDYEEDEELEVNHKNKDINKFMPIIF